MFECGFSRDFCGKVTWEIPNLLKGACGCYIFSVGPFYVTVLSKECRSYLGKKDS